MLIGSINGLLVYYISSASLRWIEELPAANWILLAVADDAAQVAAGVLATCLQSNPSGICCAGNYASVLEDCFDMEIVLKSLQWEEKHQQPFDFSLAPVTTADVALDEALWYAATLAPSMANEAIDMVVCLDLTLRHQKRITELVSLLNNGWFPPESEI